MDKIVYIDYETKICASALNTISNTVWDALGQAQTPVQARQFIGAVEEAPNDGGLYLRSNLAWVSASTSLQHNDLAGRSTADSHPISAITGLDTALSGKAPLSHTHVGSEVSGIIAAQVAYTAGGTIVATNVQAALTELGTEKLDKAGDTMTGALAINVNDASPGLLITQTGTGDCLRVEDSTTPDATPFIINNAGVVLKGLTAARANTLNGFSAALQIEGSGTSERVVAVTGRNQDGQLLLGRQNGVANGDNTAIVSGNNCGTIDFIGADGTGLIRGARISAIADGAVATGSVPMRVNVYTTPVGGTTPAERLRIDSAGTVAASGPVQLGLNSTATRNFTLTAAAADGTMKLARGNAGATTQDILTVDAAGRVSLNQSPSFVAGQGVVTTIPNTAAKQKILFGSELRDVGGNYDPTLARFTAPVAGMYLLSFYAAQGTPTNQDGNFVVEVFKNGSFTFPVLSASSVRTDNSFLPGCAGAGLTYLNAGDYVEVWGVLLGGVGGSMDTSYGGYFSGQWMGN